MSETGPRSLLLLGATGAVGRHALRQALASSHYGRVVALTRRPLGVEDPRLEAPIIDFDDLASARQWMEVTDVFNALGSTRKKAGSRERFFRIDHDYPLEVAQIARGLGADTFINISSLGAKATAMSHYLSTKGKLEDAVVALGYPKVVLVRPSTLVGDRDEERPGEAFVTKVDAIFRPLIPRQFRAVSVVDVARVALEAARECPRGVKIVESGQIGPA